MKCSDIESLISYALSPDGCDDITDHIFKCAECMSNLEIIHETMLADMVVKSDVPIGLYEKSIKDISDLVVSLSRTLKDGFQNAIKWADNIIPSFDTTPVYAYATRAIGNENDKYAASNWTFEKSGDGFSLKIEVALNDDGLNLQIRLREKSINMEVPFELSVMDADTRKVLLDKRIFTAGAAVLKGVEKGAYVISAVSNDKRLEFTLRVE